MKTFKEFLNESQDGAGLTIWDIDETLFRTTARVNIVKNGKIIKRLGNKQYNTYHLMPGESFDFSEFKDARHFRDTSEPIAKAIRKLIAMHKNIKAKGSKMIVITARSDFDDREIFLDTFRKQGIDIDDIYVHRSGNLNMPNSAAGTEVVTEKPDFSQASVDETPTHVIQDDPETAKASERKTKLQAFFKSAIASRLNVKGAWAVC